MADTKGLKRICGSCATRFYDFNKTPIICPKCETEFTGMVKVRTRRGRGVVEEVKTPEAEEEVEEKVVKKDDTEVSLDELKDKEDDGDDDEVETLDDGDLDLDDLDDDDDDDDDLDDLDGDIKLSSDDD